jgi:putative FmdB family regulatory protein
MPIYEYECGACGDRHEFIQRFSDGPKRKCPACGALRLKRLVSAAAFHLKGSGWYVTDFRDKDKKKGDGKDGKDGKSSADAKDGGKDSAAKSADKSTKSSDTGKSSGDSKSSN